MSGYVSGPGAPRSRRTEHFCLPVFIAAAVAVVLNIIGLNIGKWLQNAGGVSTYIPLLILAAIAALLSCQHGSVTHFTVSNMMPHWNLDTVNFWSQIAFAFTGLELAPP